MTPIRMIGLFCAAAILSLLVLIGVSSAEMSLAEGLRRLVETRWGITTLVDLYVGLLLVGVWIVIAERSFLRASPWIVALLLLGNLATAAYVLWRSLTSRSLEELVLGRTLSRHASPPAATEA